MSLALKLQPIIIIIAAASGILLGHLGIPAALTRRLVEFFLMTLMFLIFLAVDIRDIRRSFANVRFSAAALAINFIWTPIFAHLLGLAFLSGNLDLRTGFLMLMVTPCTDWYLIFTAMTGGNVPLGSSVLPMNLILQILLLPAYLWVFMGDSARFDPAAMIESVALVLILPLFLANAAKRAVSGTAKREIFRDAVSRHSDNAQLLLLCLAITAMFASQGRLLLGNGGLFLEMLPPLALFFAVNFVLALAVGKCMGMPFEDRVSLLFTTSARNSPISLAIAALTYPDHPLISLALVIGPLIELPILAVDSNVLGRLGRRNKSAGGKEAPPRQSGADSASGP
ncbi:MAG: bile acid:sodium symporter [Synergistaceae bacterium]|nr:bile acid:sodium symporter [Synergistaceae bacterium]